MDSATIIGILLSLGLVVSAVTMGSGVFLFLDLPAALIVLGGTVGATLVHYPLAQVLGVIGVTKKAFFASRDAPAALIARFMDYAARARREGILTLEPLLRDVRDDFLRKGLQLTVDGLEPEAIREILENEIDALESRHQSGAEILAAMGTYAPALGLIGTIIGLVQMLSRMDDPANIGPAMSVALLTALYGAMLANLVFLPLAGKLKARSREEVLVKEIMLEGVLAISRGENPRIIVEKLNSFLPPKARKATH